MNAENGIINKHDQAYADLLRHVLENGTPRIDRTGMGTISMFAPNPLRFDISETVPLLTTKKMAWKGIIKELLWFLRGDTDARILQEQGVRIWDGNSTKTFLEKRGLPYEEGILGPVYGWSFRRFGAKYDPAFADSRNITSEDAARLGGADQIKYIENLLKTDPFSRRIYVNLWNPKALNEMALPPCHLSINLYVSEDPNANGVKHLSGHVYIRSNDLFLGNPYNIFSYAVFLYILAKRTDMKPKDLIISIGDAHIYKDHVEQVHEQLGRSSFQAPTLQLADRIKDVDYGDITIDDFILRGYLSHSSIKGSMSV